MRLLIEYELEEAKHTFPVIWVVYDHPLDFPNCFIAFAYYGEVRSCECIIADTLDQVRQGIWRTGAMYKLPRSPSDDPVIVECWI